MQNVSMSRAAQAAGLAALSAAALLVSGCTNGGSVQSANVVSGKQLFVKACGSCHVLHRAGTKGNIGPNLDAALIATRVNDQGDDARRGLVYSQVLYPARGGVMPRVKIDGHHINREQANDIATYVAQAVAQPGADTGLLATAVKAAGSAKPIAEAGGVLNIAADPGGQLAFASKVATATAGPVSLQMPNQSGIDHNLVIEGNGVKIATQIIKNGVAKASGTLKPGTFAFYCAVPGHRAAGMEGTLTVK